MAVSMLPNQKVYQGVLSQLRAFIEQNDLTSGDKLPSERELSDSLQAGRSSIREALRALELLGVIETRPGEGTYLSSYRPFQTVELLASFILIERNTKDSLVATKRILEKEAAKLAFQSMEEQDIIELKKILDVPYSEMNERHIAFFSYIFKKSGNVLLTRIWQLMEEFSNTVEQHPFDEHVYEELIHLFVKKDEFGIEQLLMN